jgi:thioesterase domain-containing protein
MSLMMNALENTLHTAIPLTREIGIEVVDYTGDSLTLKAPLEKNINHKCTAFGGSLYSVSVLSGWGLIYLLLKQHNLSGHIVIQESHTKFLKPVVSNLTAKCAFESEEQRERFIRMYRRKGLARIQLESRMLANGDSHVIFNGNYVVHA